MQASNFAILFVDVCGSTKIGTTKIWRFLDLCGLKRQNKTDPLMANLVKRPLILFCYRPSDFWFSIFVPSPFRNLCTSKKVLLNSFKHILSCLKKNKALQTHIQRKECLNFIPTLAIWHVQVALDRSLHQTLTRVGCVTEVFPMTTIRTEPEGSGVKVQVVRSHFISSLALFTYAELFWQFENMCFDL